MNTISKTMMGLVMAGAFLVAAGTAASSTASAQSWPNRDRGTWNDNDRNDRNRDRDRDWDRDRDRDRYRDNGGYNGGYYGNQGGYYGDNRYYNAERQKGYQDGFRRGREDAESNRFADPNNSSHYRKGNGAYREGFRSAYFEAFRQFTRFRRW